MTRAQTPAASQPAAAPTRTIVPANETLSPVAYWCCAVLERSAMHSEGCHLWQHTNFDLLAGSEVVRYQKREEVAPGACFLFCLRSVLQAEQKNVSRPYDPHQSPQTLCQRLVTKRKIQLISALFLQNAASLGHTHTPTPFRFAFNN